MIFEFLKTNKNFKLFNFLIAANLSKTTYYYCLRHKNDDDIKNKEIMDKITTIFNKHNKKYGSRRICQVLKNEGIVINHKKVERLMRKMNLKCSVRKVKYHSFQGTVGTIADNIINRNFTANSPNEKWSTDVSQFNLKFGKAYLSPIIDMCTGEVVSYVLSRNPNFEQVKLMLNLAFEKNNNLDGCILHSDMGWQYQMKEYNQMLKEKNMIQSMSRKGNCYDNCIIESFFGILKNEMFYGEENTYETFEQFSKSIDDYIYYYNNIRIRKKSKWKLPIIYKESFANNNVVI